MYEIATIISLLIILLLCVIQVGTNKRIDTLRDSYTEFLTQYAVYIKAVGDHSEAVQGALEELDNKAEKGYCAVTALAAHTEYLQAQLEELKEYQDKRIVEVDQND